MSVIGVGSGFLLWFTGFMVVGGEWFAMWQSRSGTAQRSAFRFYMTLLAVVIFSISLTGRLVRMISKRACWRRRGRAGSAFAGARPARAALPPISMARHEQAMRLAIEEARRNPVYPFGAVIVRADNGEVMARGVNNARRESDPARRDRLHERLCPAATATAAGASQVLYTTGEPCSMCMSALVWAGIGGVVFASSIDGIKRAGIDQIEITAKAVADASPLLQRACCWAACCGRDRPHVHGRRKR